MRRFLIGLLVRLLDATAIVDYKKIDRKALENWAYSSFDNAGWRSYFAYETMRILKEMSYGKDRDAYMILIGRRLQLLYLFDEMKKSVENRKAAEEIRAAKARSEAKSA